MHKCKSSTRNYKLEEGNYGDALMYAQEAL